MTWLGSGSRAGSHWRKEKVRQCENDRPHSLLVTADGRQTVSVQSHTLRHIALLLAPSPPTDVDTGSEQSQIPPGRTLCALAAVAQQTSGTSYVLLPFTSVAVGRFGFRGVRQPSSFLFNFEDSQVEK